jgi:hypothetical protein
MTSAVTEAQERILAAVNEAGSCSFDGRSSRSIEALEAAGLITVDWDGHRDRDGSAWQIKVHSRLAHPRGAAERGADQVLALAAEVQERHAAEVQETLAATQQEDDAASAHRPSTVAARWRRVRNKRVT